MKKTEARYVVCIKAEGAGDLEVRKLYRVLPDEAAAARRHLRILDEAGEEYLYPEEWFAPVAVSEDAERALARQGEPLE